jgi:enhanced entry protein EnhC
MKSLPWLSLVTVLSTPAYAVDGLDAYRQGNYTLAAKKLSKSFVNDPVASYYLGLMQLYGYGQLKNNTAALRHFTAAATRNYTPAQRLLGQYYLNSAHNPEHAFQWFKKVAATEDTPAKMYVAGAYLFGFGVKKDTQLAKRYYIDAAKKGNDIAQFATAMQFLEGHNKSHKKLGLIWLKKSAANNNPNAEFKLSQLYASGNLVERDTSKADALLKQAARQNFQPAVLMLATRYLDEKNPYYNSKLGLSLMLKAAHSGSIDAQKEMAAIYKAGKILPADNTVAEQWEQRALKTTTEKSTSKIAVKVAQWLSSDKKTTFSDAYQLSGIYNSWQNSWALKENSYNQPPQMSSITRQQLYKPQFMMINPDRIPIDEYFNTSIPMLTTNDSSNWTFPRYSLIRSIEILQDIDSMIQRHETNIPLIKAHQLQEIDNDDIGDYLAQTTKGWQQKANYQLVLNQLYEQAILGNASAQFELGQLYQYGIGVGQNIAQAMIYYQLAAAQQDIRAEYNLATLYLEGKTTPVDYRKGLMWMTGAAFKGNPYAEYVLANMYEQGFYDNVGQLIVTPNHQQAINMYSLASANNNGQAQYQLAELLVKDRPLIANNTIKKQHQQMIKRLYQGAVEQGVTAACLPLAFYNATDTRLAYQNYAFDIAKKEAEAGNLTAALLVAIMFERGIAVTQDNVAALYWYKKSGHNPISDFILGTYYAQGYGLTKDAEKGRDLLQQSADLSFSWANLNLAILNQQQGGNFLVELTNAYQAGNHEAGLLLADYYLLRANDPDKMKQARAIYQSLAEIGDRDAQTKLAFLYDRGLGGPVNSDLAVHWYQLAANQQHTVAQFLLGQLYQRGHIDKIPNYDEAKKWYELAKQTNAKAATALGFIYEIVDNNYQKAFENYQLAANSKDAIGQFNLGLMYEYGKGITVDMLQAKKLYSQAAKKGYANAMTQLAGFYLNGIGNNVDNQKALYWYRKAARLKNSTALYQLGVMSETGIATQIDSNNTVTFYQQAANLGNDKAKLALARIYQYGLGVTQDLQHTADIYRDLATHDNAYAQYQLAVLYLEDALGQHQQEQGRMLLQQADNNGSQQAHRMTQWLNAQQGVQLSFIEPIAVNAWPTPFIPET